MTNKMLYLKYHDLLKGIDLPEMANEVFLMIVNSFVADHKLKPTDSDQLSRFILYTALLRLAEKFKPANFEQLVKVVPQQLSWVMEEEINCELNQI